MATGFANEYGKKTINHTAGGQWLSDQVALLKDFYGPALVDKFEGRAWDQASMYFAQQASGTVHTFPAAGGAMGTYIRVEKPMLESGGAAEVICIFPQ